MTTRDDIEQWFNEGLQQGVTHLIVVCDTFDWEDYPVYVKRTDNVYELYNQYNGVNMQKVMEVYNLSLDKERQLNETCSRNF